MKKSVFLLVCVLILTLTACKNTGSTSSDGADSASPSASPSASAAVSPGEADLPTASASPSPTALPPETGSPSPSPSPSASSSPSASPSQSPDLYSATLEIQSYFPMQGDVHLVYEGSGNEFAPYELYVDYIGSGRIQYRYISDATINCHVYINEDGMLKKVCQSEAESMRTNLLNARTMEEILLKAPITLGDSWDAGNGKTRTVTAVNTSITVPYGTFDTVEITAEGNGSTTKEYYAPGAGLLRTDYYATGSDLLAIRTQLASVEFDVPYTWYLMMYYPDFQTDGPVYTERAIDLYTNDNPGAVIGEAGKSTPDSSALTPLVPANAAILGSYYNANTGVVTVDLSSNFISAMNVGANFEGMTLTCLANTFGRAYATNLVSITVDSGPYESGHFYFGSGDYVATDFINVSPL